MQEAKTMATEYNCCDFRCNSFIHAAAAAWCLVLGADDDVAGELDLVNCEIESCEYFPRFSCEPAISSALRTTRAPTNKMSVDLLHGRRIKQQVLHIQRDGNCWRRREILMCVAKQSLIALL